MLFSIIIFVLTLLVLVVIHEFGHFLLAKKFGIKVKEFGFGIPPRLWGKKIGETIYSINWLPFGGFVKLLGEEDQKEGSPSRNFARKPVFQRIVVVIAGVVMNLILAWVLFYIVIAAQNFRVITPALEPGVYIGRVEENFPAKEAGIKPGDRLLSVDGKAVSSFDEARSLIKEKESAISLQLQDSKGVREVVLTAKEVGGERLIGVVFAPFLIKEYKTPVEKIFSGITYSFDLTRLTFMGLGKTITQLISGQFGQVSQQVSGPVGIAAMSGEILQGGWQAAIPYLWFVGIISLTLAIFNIFPIPALDGGRLLFLLIEALTGKKVKSEIENLIHQVGFAILITLALLITYSDIKKFFI
ncbi:site-2 protease family protein [Candidatus Daviesbacteria bacterium]|nr:site-2 protease family protein [Candidatus Daviesbacteria bacterium]